MEITLLLFWKRVSIQGMPKMEFRGKGEEFSFLSHHTWKVAGSNQIWCSPGYETDYLRVKMAIENVMMKIGCMKLLLGQK